MTTCKLITYTDLTLLCYIYLCHLQDAGREVAANGYGKLATLKLCIKQFILTYVVHNELLDELVGVLIVSPRI